MDFVRVWHADTCTMGLGTSYVVMKHGKWETWRYRVAFISFKRYPKKEIFYLKFLKLTILILARIYMIPRWYTFNRSLPCDSIRFYERVGSGIVEELIFCNHQWKCFICPGFTCRWCVFSVSGGRTNQYQYSASKDFDWWFWLIFSQLKTRMSKWRNLKAGILQPGITKIKHRTDKGWFTPTTQA